MPEPEPSQETTVALMNKAIKDNAEDIAENKDSIKDCETKNQELRDIVIETKTYQKSTHEDVLSIRESMLTISQSIPMPPAAAQPSITSPLPIQNEKTDWGEWLMKHLFLILVGLVCTVMGGTVVYLITSALSK